MATLRISRASDNYSYLRYMIVVVDGKSVGELALGETKDLTIDAGEHKVWVKIDWTRSPKIVFSVQSDDQVSFSCGGVFAENPAIGLCWAIVVPVRALWLRKTSEHMSEPDIAPGLSGWSSSAFNRNIKRVILVFTTLTFVLIAAVVAYLLTPKPHNDAVVTGFKIAVPVACIISGGAIGVWLSSRKCGRAKNSG